MVVSRPFRAHCGEILIFTIALVARHVHADKDMAPAPTPEHLKEFDDTTAPAKRPRKSALPYFQSQPETKAYYRSLVQRYHKGDKISLEDFNRTFFPVDPEPLPARELFVRCTDNPQAPDCYPDAYYSWGTAEKAKAIADRTPDGAMWTQPLNDRNIWTTSSSISTYCYGRFALRFRFRKGMHPPANRYNNPWKNLAEYAIQGEESSLVESVSYGQPQHFDEMITEIQRRLAPAKPWKDTRLYVDRNPPGGSHKVNKEKLIHGCLSERGIPLGEKELVHNLIDSLQIVLDGGGWIHTQACDGCAAENHFKTNTPTFFNSR